MSAKKEVYLKHFFLGFTPEVVLYGCCFFILLKTQAWL